MRALRWLLSGVLLVMLAGVMTVRFVHTRMETGVIPVGQTPSAIAVDGPARHAFVTNYLDNTVTMIDTNSGAVLRTIPVGQAPSAVVVDAHTSRVFILNQKDSSVSMLDATTGDVLGTRYIPNSTALAVDEQSGHIFVVSNSNATFTSPGMLAMLDARSGRLLNHVPLGGAAGWVLKGLTIDPGAGRGWLTNCLDGTVGMFDTHSGRIVTTRRVGGCPLAVVAAAGAGHAFVTNQGDGTVRMLDLHTAAVLHTVGVGQIPTALAVNGRSARVFVLASDMSTMMAAVSVLDAHTGALRGRINLAPSSPTAPCVLLNAIGIDDDHSRAFILVGRVAMQGSVSVLDGRSGRVLRTLTAGGAPIALAVDEMTDHLFVLNQALGNPRGGGGVSGQTTWGWVTAWLRQWLPGHHQPVQTRLNGSVAVLDLAHL